MLEGCGHFVSGLFCREDARSAYSAPFSNACGMPAAGSKQLIDLKRVFILCRVGLDGFPSIAPAWVFGFPNADDTKDGAGQSVKISLSLQCNNYKRQ
jgi:hypothetical protein